MINQPILKKTILLFLILMLGSSIYANSNRDIFDEAKIAFDEENYEKAHKLSDLYLKDSLNNETLLMCKALMIKAFSLHSLEKSEEALSLVTKAQKLNKKSNLSRQSYYKVEKEITFLLGYLNYEQENYKYANFYLEKLKYPLSFEILNDRFEEIRSVSAALCRSYNELGELNKIVEYGNKTLDESAEMKEDSLSADIKTILAKALFKLGYGGYVPLQKEANDFFKKEGKHYELAEGFFSLAKFYISYSDENKEFIRDASELCKQHNLKNLLLRIKRHEAVKLFNEGVYNQANLKLDTALLIAKSLNDIWEISVILAWQSKVYLESGQIKIALEKANQIDVSLLEKHYMEDDLLISEVLGSVFGSSQKYKLSQIYFERANALREMTFDKNEKMRIEQEKELVRLHLNSRDRVSTSLKIEKQKSKNLYNQLFKWRITAISLLIISLVILGRFLFEKLKKKSVLVQEIIKTVDEKSKTLDEIRKEEYFFQKENKSIAYEEIVSFKKEKGKRTVKIVFLNRKTIFEEISIKDLEEKLPKQLFFKTNQSWIINLEKIDNYDRGGDSVTLVNGGTAYVSRNFKKNLFMRYKALE